VHNLIKDTTHALIYDISLIRVFFLSNEKVCFLALWGTPSYWKTTPNQICNSAFWLLKHHAMATFGRVKVWKHAK